MRRREAVYLAIVIAIGGLILVWWSSARGEPDSSTVQDTTPVGAANASATLLVAQPATPTSEATATPQPPAVAASRTPIPTYMLVYSTSWDRSDPQPLDGATLSAEIYAFVPHNNFMDQVDFYLDDELVREEKNSPYDLAGGLASTAAPWDTRTVADGEHTIRAVIKFDDGSTTEISATFATENGVDVAPSPGPGALAEPGTGSSGEASATSTPTLPEGTMRLVATFRSISVYVGYRGARASLPVAYRQTGGEWRQGHPLWVDPAAGEARGSLVELEPDTTYEVRVGAVTKSISTRAEDIPTGTGAQIDVTNAVELQAALDTAGPGDVIRLAPGEYVGPFTLARGGLARSYLTIDGGGAAVLSGNAGAVANVLTLDDADYVRITGLTVRDAGRNLITLLNGSDYVVIEGNQLIEPAYHEKSDLPDVAAAIHLRDGSGGTVIRDNSFHRETVMTAKHSFPAVYAWKAGWGLIITGNTTTGGFEDSFRWGPEDSPEESQSRDIDIYGNTIDGACFDDGIQPEGIAINVRVWGNMITHCYVAMAFAPTIDGPLYVFRNIVVANVHPIRGGAGIFKLGDEDDGRRGPKYFYHNTLIADAPLGYVTVWKQTNSGVGNVISRNNIAVASKYIIELGCDLTCDMNVDALWTVDRSRFIDYRSEKFPNLRAWCDAYQNGCNSLRLDARRDLDANFRLREGSRLVDAGVPIPGFNDGYLGAAPDLGAVETR